jgi:GR25 family glycosyltransferase involved in LPS biosynthesis
MAVIDITTQVYFSEKDVLVGFVNLTNSKNLIEPVERIVGTVQLLHHVSDAELLYKITKDLEQKGFVTSTNILMQLDETEIGNYTRTERTRLQAAIYSLSTHTNYLLFRPKFLMRLLLLRL